MASSKTLSTDIDVSGIPCAAFNAALGAIPFADTEFAGITGVQINRTDGEVAYGFPTTSAPNADGAPCLSRETAIEIIKLLILISSRRSDSQRKALYFYQAALDHLTVGCPTNADLMRCRDELLHAYEWKDSYAPRVRATSGNEAFESKATYVYRKKRVFGLNPCAIQPTEVSVDADGKLAKVYFHDTNKQVYVDAQKGSLLWFKPYHSGNDLGFFPDMMFAFVRDAFPIADESDAYACYLLHIGVIWSDLHAWLAHQYSFSPIEQEVDGQKAANKIFENTYRGYSMEKYVGPSMGFRSETGTTVDMDASP